MPPVGPYKSFGSCVGAQKRKGRGEESARKICGSIEQKTRKSKGKKGRKSKR